MCAIRLLALLAFASALMARTGFGQSSFDKLGNATGAGTTPSVITVDLIEIQSQLSDIVRFENISNIGRLCFISDLQNGEGSPDPADVVALSAPLGGAVPLVEVDPEGANGAVWSPTPSSSAPSDLGFGVMYTLISDVPEP